VTHIVCLTASFTSLVHHEKSFPGFISTVQVTEYLWWVMELTGKITHCQSLISAINTSSVCVGW